MDCPRCHSANVVKRGKNRNKYVEKQTYSCKDCGKRFTPDDGFKYMTFPKEIVVKALHLYAEGLSLSKVRDYIYQHEGYWLYDSTILYWVKKYAGLLKWFEKKRMKKPKVKGRIHSDEVVLKVKGEKHYSINSIDSGTMYNLGHTFTRTRDDASFKAHFRVLKGMIYDQILEVYKKEQHKPVKERKLITFVSDGLEQYKTAFNKHFLNVARLVHGVPIACRKHGLEHNNNHSERHNEDIKQRYKVMRGLKVFGPAEAFLDLRRYVYNFIRGSERVTPAEAAQIELDLGRNRLMDLIFLPPARGIDMRPIMELPPRQMPSDMVTPMFGG